MVVLVAGSPPVTVTYAVYVVRGVEEVRPSARTVDSAVPETVIVGWTVVLIVERTVWMLVTVTMEPVTMEPEVQGPQRSVMVMVTVGVFLGVRAVVIMSVTVEGSPETVASGRPLVKAVSVWTFVTVGGLPETVASGRLVVYETSVWTFVRVDGLAVMVASPRDPYAGGVGSTVTVKVTVLSTSEHMSGVSWGTVTTVVMVVVCVEVGSWSVVRIE